MWDVCFEEARALVNCIQEGIYEEYGWALKKKQADGITIEMIKQEKAARTAAFKIHVG